MRALDRKRFRVVSDENFLERRETLWKIGQDGDFHLAAIRPGLEHAADDEIAWRFDFALKRFRAMRVCLRASRRRGRVYASRSRYDRFCR